MTASSALGVAVLEHYGSSETAQIASNMPPPGPRKPGTCGIPWPDTIKIVRTRRAAQVPVGEQGEILVNRRDVMSGYLNSPELNQLAFIDGWYRTGDIGGLDADGFLSLHARKREMINRGAEKIAPIEIDHALMRHPEVAEAAAYGVPHARYWARMWPQPSCYGGARKSSLPSCASSSANSSPPSDPASYHHRGPVAERNYRQGAADAVEWAPLQGARRRSAGPHAEPFRFWRRLKQFATLALPSHGSAVDHWPKPNAGTIISEKSVPSDGDLHAELLQVWKRLLKVEKLSIDDDFFEEGRKFAARDGPAYGDRATHRQAASGIVSVRGLDHSRLGQGSFFLKPRAAPSLSCRFSRESMALGK